METILNEGIHVPVNDPNFVEWFAYFYDSEKIVDKYTLVGVHLCSDKDFDEFHEIVEY